MEKIIVTSGQPFTDIDALACTLAYTELLNLEGKNAFAVLPGPLNKSITEKIKSWNLDFLKKPESKNAKYISVCPDKIFLRKTFGGFPFNQHRR